MTQDPDNSILEEQAYNLRPKISLTPLGKNTQACHSIAVARTTNVLQIPETPKHGLQVLEDNLGGPVTMQDVHDMVVDNPSIDLTPPIANQILTPEITNHRYNKRDLNDLLDSHGFSAPGEVVHLFTPDPKKTSGTSQTYALASPREVESFFSSRSFPKNTTGDSPFRNSTTGDSPPNQAFSDSDLTAKPPGVSSNSGGRPTNRTQNLLTECFQELDELLRKTADQTGRTPEHIVDLWLQRRASARQIKSSWNKYQRYFTDHAEEERNRVGDATASAKDCWPSFPHTYPDWEAILNNHEEFHSIQGQESTLAQRQKEFKKMANKLSAMMADNARRSGFEGFFVMVGNCINEDSGLGHVSVTPGAENVLEERLGVDQDSLAAQVKAHVYNNISLKFKDSLVCNREANVVYAQDAQDGKQVEGSGGDEVEVTSYATSAPTMSYGEMTIGVRNFFHAAFVGGDATISATQLPWFCLAKTTAQQSRQIINWPEGVPFAGEGAQSGQKKTGIKALSTASLTCLYQAFSNPETAPRVVPADRAAMLEGKTPVFIGAAPSATSSASHGRRYFLSGRSDNLGLPRLTATKPGPMQSAKVEKATTSLIPSSKSSLSPLTPTPKPKSKGKEKAKKIESNSENDDDEPLEAPKRKKTRIPKKLVIADDEDDLFLDDSESDFEEVAAISSARLRSHVSKIAKNPLAAPRPPSAAPHLPSPPPPPPAAPRPAPRPKIAKNPLTAPHPPSTAPHPPLPPPPSAAPPPPPAAPRPLSAVPRPPSGAPRSPSGAPHPPSAATRPPSPHPSLAAHHLASATTRSPSATPRSPSAVRTHPLLSSSSSLPAPTLDTLRNPPSAKRAADLMNGGQVPDLPSKRSRSTEATGQTVSQREETQAPVMSTAHLSQEPSPPLAASTIVQIKKEGNLPPISSLPYPNHSSNPLPDQYYPMYWSNYPSYNPYPGSHQFPPPALLNQPAIYQNPHLPPSGSHYQLQGYQPPQGSHVQQSHTSHLPQPPSSHLHLPPNPNPYYYNPTQPPPTYGFPPGANYGPSIGCTGFQAPYSASHNQEGNRGSSNGPAPDPNV